MNLKHDLWLKYHLNFPISGENGESKEDAIKILLNNNLGILLEKDIIACIYCEGEYNFKLIDQTYLNEGKSNFDILTIELPNKEIRKIYFEISDFFGKSFEYFKRDCKEYSELVKRMLIRPDIEK